MCVYGEFSSLLFGWYIYIYTTVFYIYTHLGGGWFHFFVCEVVLLLLVVINIHELYLFYHIHLWYGFLCVTIFAVMDDEMSLFEFCFTKLIPCESSFGLCNLWLFTCFEVNCGVIFLRNIFVGNLSCVNMVNDGCECDPLPFGILCFIFCLLLHFFGAFDLIFLSYVITIFFSCFMWIPLL